MASPMTPSDPRKGAAELQGIGASPSSHMKELGIISSPRTQPFNYTPIRGPPPQAVMTPSSIAFSSPSRDTNFSLSSPSPMWEQDSHEIRSPAAPSFSPRQRRATFSGSESNGAGVFDSEGEDDMMAASTSKNSVGGKQQRSSSARDLISTLKKAPPELKRSSSQKPSSSSRSREDRDIIREFDMKDVTKYIKKMQSIEEKDRTSAAAKLYRVISDHQQARTLAFSEGALPVILKVIKEDKHFDKQLRRYCTGLVSTLCLEAYVKTEIIRTDGFAPLIELLLLRERSSNARATSAHAASALWKLCVNEGRIKRALDRDDVLDAVVRMCEHEETLDVYNACGLIAELCLGQKDKRSMCKNMLHRLGAVRVLLLALARGEDSVERVAASALCNLMAHQNEIKVTCIRSGVIEAFAAVVKRRGSNETLVNSCAGGLYNLASAQEKQRYEKLGVIATLRSIRVSRDIDQRLRAPELISPMAQVATARMPFEGRVGPDGRSGPPPIIIDHSDSEDDMYMDVMLHENVKAMVI